MTEVTPPLENTRFSPFFDFTVLRPPGNYPHGWLDDNGRNEWAEWKTYIQDKENSVWEATLHIATSATGEKVLYDIDPIKMAEQFGNSDTSTAQSTPPARGGDENVAQAAAGVRRFNPRPPRGGATGQCAVGVLHHVISIHAPCEGGDIHTRRGHALRVVISIHAPREGGDCKRRPACR